MHIDAAKATVHRIRHVGADQSIRFVDPITSCMLASMSLNADDSPCLSKVSFAPDAEQYAKYSGLLDLLHGNYQPPSLGGSHGSTYSKLTRISDFVCAEQCTAVINGLFRQQLSGCSQDVVRPLSRAVGELHDNVAAHARGVGFSAAQVYTDARGKRIEMACVDTGCGMLRNVEKVCDISDDRSAIDWCLTYGNTTAVPDPMAQRLPEDFVVSPYPTSAPVIRPGEEHHAGVGLWQLLQLIRGFEGSISVLSGLGEFRYNSGRERWIAPGPGWRGWQGVAVEFEIFVPTGGLTVEIEKRLSEFAGRMGI